MTQNTEQHTRTQDEQVAEIVERVTDLSLVNCYPDFGEVQDWMIEAEARGAEEQRRKDAEETQHLWDHLATINNYGFQFDPEKDDPKKLADACIKAAREAIENPPANVAAPEARIVELVEAEQLARADAEASKANAENLKKVALDVLQVCQRSKMGPSDLGYVTNMIRAALTHEGGV